MKIGVKRTHIKKEERNRVTSHLILEPHRRQKAESLVYHDEGIFSKRIFGNLYRCDCGALSEEGICEECGTRVVEPQHMPDFYIELCCWCHVAFPNWDKSHRNDDGKWNRRIKVSLDEIKSIADYRAFLYVDGDVDQVVWADENLDPSKWDNSKILIGVDALKHVGIPEEWIKESMVDWLSIPHTIYRPMVISGSNPFVTPINDLYSTIIKKINNALDMQEMAKGRPLYLLAQYHVISDLYHQILNSLFAELQDAEYSILKSEIISHPISGAVRATLVNRHDVHEDVIILGDTLVETLYPYLFKRFEGSMELINKHLVETDAVILVNRPPTINHASIVAMKPRIASIYPVGKIHGTNRALLHNEEYCKRRNLLEADPENPNLGDVEKYGQGFEKDEMGNDDGIDVLGLRCVGANPIMMDAMNADVDGDVLLSVALYSTLAMEEARSIVPSKSYLNYANGTIRNHIIEDFIYAERE